VRYRFVAATGIIIALLVVSFFYVKNSPHYSLYQLKRAVEDHDPDEALKYIDVDSIVDGLGASFFGKTGEGTGHEEGRRSHLKRLAAEAMPGIKESVRSSFRAAIASRGEEKQSEEKQKDKVVVRNNKSQAPSIGGVEINGLDLRKLKETSLWDLLIQRDGKTAKVSLKNNPGIKAKMIQTDQGNWQITQIVLTQ
jgi:hypothetical protein